MLPSAVADPGFSRGGGANPQGGQGHQDTISIKLHENCMKVKKIRLQGWGTGPLRPP